MDVVPALAGDLQLKLALVVKTLGARAEAADFNTDLKATGPLAKMTEVIAGPVSWFESPRGGRGHADHRDRCPWTWQPMELPLVAVTMQDETAPLPDQDLMQCHRIRQPLAVLDRFRIGRMMEQHDSAQACASIVLKQPSQALQLGVSYPAGCQKRRAGRRRIHPDENRRATPSKRGETGRVFGRIAREVRFPIGERVFPGGGDVTIVIARNHGDLFGRSQTRQPVRRLPIFLDQPELGQVAGDDGVIWPLGLKVLNQCFQDLRQVFAAAAKLPGKVP